MNKDHQNEIFSEIREERKRQNVKWGEQNHPMIHKINDGVDRVWNPNKNILERNLSFFRLFGRFFAEPIRRRLFLK